MTPSLQVAPAPPAWASQLSEFRTWDWNSVPTLSPFIVANGSRLADYTTTVRVCADSYALYTRFDCVDPDIWANYTERDDPIYDEEVVEVFLSPGAATPTSYYEFEISPTGVLFDALIENPLRSDAEIVVKREWDCDGILWATERNDDGQHWWATLVLPWAAFAVPEPFPTTWRANFYRIERPRTSEPEFSCWSPTMTEPAAFHRPAYFGTLLLEDSYAHL